MKTKAVRLTLLLTLAAFTAPAQAPVNPPPPGDRPPRGLPAVPAAKTGVGEPAAQAAPSATASRNALRSNNSPHISKGDVTPDAALRRLVIAIL